MNRLKWALVFVLLLSAAALTAAVVVAGKAASDNAAAQVKRIDANTQAVQALRADAQSRDRQADAQQKASAAFVDSFLRAQAAQCHAILDADRRLGAVIPVEPDPCVLALPTPTPTPGSP